MGSAEAAIERYALITPAKNEEAFIAGAIDSILAQRERPLRWVIVSDGSTDRTDEIVSRYAGRHDFIQLLRRASPQSRSVSSKVAAFRQGYSAIADIAFGFIGNLDADITLAPEYYAHALARFAEQPHLGICGAIYWNRVGGALQRSRTRASDTSGCAQLFRRRCYEEIGGYRSLELGGEDTMAGVMARMKGWTTRSFAEPTVIHNRPLASAGGRRLLGYRFQQGAINYGWGAHPLFMIAKALGRLDEPPRVLGSAALLGGYFSAWMRGAPHPPADVVAFIHREQMQRLMNRLRSVRGREHRFNG